MKEFYRVTATALSCLFLLSFFEANAQVQTARNITTGPNCNGFYEYLPAGYNTKHAPYPLMIFLSGEWQQGNGTTDLPLVLQYGPPQIIAAGQWPDSFKVDGQTFQYVVISPQFTIWEAETDIDGVINYALSHYNVDPHRVYLTGYSAGGGMTWAYAGYNNTYANKLAAIVPISAAIGINDQQAHNIAVADVPVYTTHNIDDSSVPVSFCIANVAAVNTANPPPGIKAIDTIFPNRGFRHNAWTATYCPCFTNAAIQNWNIYQWMLHYSRSGLNKVVPNSPDTTSSPPPPPPPPPPVTVPQPVALTTYTATVVDDGKEVAVNWNTAKEIGNNYFVVQRSTDSVSFIDLDTVRSAAHSGGGASYQFTDTMPVTGADFYRLERVDSAAKDTLYPVLKVLIGKISSPPPTITPLPVALTLYTAAWVENGKAVDVDWTTAHEQGNKYFVVQRSADSLNFISLDTVASAAAPNSGYAYVYTDSTPMQGKNFYRLQRVDIDGMDTLYPVLKVADGSRLISISPMQGLLLGPNPSPGLVYLHLVDSAMGTLSVSIMDMQGRTMRVWIFQKQDLVWDQSIDVSGLSKGGYVLQILGTGIREVRTILKE